MAEFKTLDEVTDFIISLLPDEERLIIAARTCDETYLRSIGHHTIGRHIRNSFKLWEDSSADLKQKIWDSLTEERRNLYRKWWKGQHEGKDMHADDASDELLEAVVKKIRRNTNGVSLLGIVYGKDERK